MPPNVKRQKAAQSLACGASIRRAAVFAGVAPGTIARWQAEPSFRGQVQQLRDGSFGQAVGRLTAASARAAAQLVKLLADKSPKVRLAAARAILDETMKTREAADLITQISELRQRLTDLQAQRRPRVIS